MRAKINQMDWLPQITSGQMLSESLDRVGELQVIPHASLSEEREYLAEQTLDTVLWWYESTDRLDPVGVLMLKWNLRLLQIRFDHMIRTLKREGTWLTVRETQRKEQGEGRSVIFYLVADNQPRILSEGMHERYLVWVPT